MKKMSLLEFFGGPGPGYPELPSPKNKHHFSKNPHDVKNGFYYSHGKSTYPYDNPKDDLNLDGELENQEVLNITDMFEGLFGRTMSAGDNTSLSRPSTSKIGNTGGGTGKTAQGFGDFDVATLDPEDATDEETSKRLDGYFAREENRVKPVMERRGARDAYSDQPTVTTQQPFASGLPTGNEPWRAETHLEKEEEFINSLLDGDLEI